jgi:hypothetical protein
MEQEEKHKQIQTNKKSLLFIKEIAKYFMDFLETDFHKRRNPKRSIKLQNEDNLLIGLNLKKYNSFSKLVWKGINHAFDKNIVNELKKGVHKTDIPKNLLDLVKKQIDIIQEKQINEVIKNIAEILKKQAVLYKDEYNKAISVSIDESSKTIREDLVLPFVKTLEKSLVNLNLGDENTIYIMEEELSDILIRSIKDKISELLNLLINKEKVDVVKNIKTVLNLKDVKTNLTEFFERFKVADLFSEIFEIEKNKNILDKKEFYLYFSDITFDRVKYPIFYIPFEVKKKDDSFLIDFDSQIYINKKALEYIVQEYNKNNSKKGSLKLISERIIYLANQKDDLVDVLQSIINEINNFFELDSKIDLRDDLPQRSRSLFAQISNSSYICLFDKSDEAMINDYEDILQMLSEEDSILGQAFNRLIEDFIHKNPKTFGDEIYNEWDDLEPSDKLVFNTPIPLNSEQRQILSAINKNNCNYITVEGPPGTGKSHTITAIVFDAILNKKSVLVLSDKKEALDVVEDKISETMNKVRHDKNFQNPILRLGKTGNTYSQILSTSSIENIKMHYRAVKKEFSSIEKDIDKTVNTLKEDLEAEILSYEDIDINEIYEVINLEEIIQKEQGVVFDLTELLERENSAVEIEEIRASFLKIKEIFVNDEINNKIEDIFDIDLRSFNKINDFKLFADKIVKIINIANKLSEHFVDETKIINIVDNFKDQDLKILDKYIKDFESQKHWLFGYAFKNKKIEELDSNLKEYFYSLKLAKPSQSIDDLKKLLKLFVFSENLRKENNFKFGFDCASVIYKLLKNNQVRDFLSCILEITEDIKYLENILNNYKETIVKIKFNLTEKKDYINNPIIDIDELEFNKLIRYINLKQKVTKEFKDIPLIDYVNQKKNIESLVTTQMTYIMDERVVNFYQENQATAKTLRNIIKSKQRFPKKDFINLKEAFPCILAGIRDYAEYIPLEPEMFDFVIIDEASQVSIAQAFPALLRAKKVLILGDKKQFSNVKASLARSDTNREFLNNVENVFKANISKDDDKLVKLKKFDIKTSILEFFEFISNYNAQLLKHFRGYKEIISYSNKFFYGDLQAMKIRGKNINEVLKFSFVKHDGKEEVIRNTNSLEIDFIISELKKLKEQDKNSSVGIITPHTNQQKLIMEKISKLPENDYFFEKLNLKIMTFDTCQGEERDIIYYSMVATEKQDHLWGVFIKNLQDVDLEEEGKIKAQRLNVGFSRAKECMHFILSKDIDKFNGSIGEALRHYQYTLDEAKKEKDVSSVDKKSKMEPEVLNWFYQTNFWNTNKDNIEFIPQFKIGDYLKQLDKFYTHPNYIVDFLLIYKDEKHYEHKIIIEYDGFQEHFKDIDEVNEFNYNHYYSDEDVLRQKSLEGYGYKFIRVNKFNSGENPIETLNNRIESLLKNGFNGNKTLSNIHKTIEGLQNGEMKECPKCKKVQSLNSFRDNSLITGYGRFCNECKNISTRASVTIKSAKKGKIIDLNKICPTCGAGMVLRSGRYGKFYGCSKYPYCRGTKKY